MIMHEVWSDLANLIPYQETVQTEFNSGMTISAKPWCSVVSLKAVQKKKADLVLRVRFRLSPEPAAALSEATFESTDRPVSTSSP